MKIFLWIRFICTFCRKFFLIELLVTTVPFSLVGLLSSPERNHGNDEGEDDDGWTGPFVA